MFRELNIDRCRKTRWFLAGVLCAMAAGSLAFIATNGCSRRDAPPEGSEEEQAAHGGDPARNANTVTAVSLPPEAIQRAEMRVESAEEHVLTPSFLVPARVSFNEEAMAQVGTPVPGRVNELKVKLGDVVRRDDVLLLVESPQLGEAESAYLEKRTALAAASAAMEPLQRALDRAQNLYQQGQIISGAEVQRRESEYLLAEGMLKAAQSALATAELKLEMLGLNRAAIDELKNGKPSLQYPIRAPIDGTVVARSATLGELVSPDKQSLLTLADMTTLWVLADVPEAKLPEVAKGTKARVRLATARDDVIEGQVSYIASHLAPGTRSAEVRIEVSGRDPLVKPGVFAEAELFASQSEHRQPVLAVPAAAVQTVDGRAIVFTPAPKRAGVFVKREVEAGSEVGGMVPILSGLRRGEKIVTQGTFILKAELGKAAAGQEDAD